MKIFISYLIIIVVFAIIGICTKNSVDLIVHKEATHTIAQKSTATSQPTFSSSVDDLLQQ